MTTEDTFTLIKGKSNLLVEYKNSGNITIKGVLKNVVLFNNKVKKYNYLLRFIANGHPNHRSPLTSHNSNITGDHYKLTNNTPQPFFEVDDEGLIKWVDSRLVGYDSGEPSKLHIPAKLLADLYKTNINADSTPLTREDLNKFCVETTELN